MAKALGSLGLGQGDSGFDACRSPGVMGLGSASASGHQDHSHDCEAPPRVCFSKKTKQNASGGIKTVRVHSICANKKT